MLKTEDRGSGRIATRNYLVKTPKGLFPAVVEQGYIPEQGGGEIARLQRQFPDMIHIYIVGQ